MGQAHPRASREVKAQAVFHGESALTRVVTCRGRTNAVLMLAATATEETEILVQAMAEKLPAAGLQQVRCVTVDNPSGKLWKGLRCICPNLQILCLDPVHLAMTCEYASSRKRTAMSKTLRAILQKLSVRSSRCTENTWGTIFRGDNAKPLTHEEQKARSQIEDRSMPLKKATAVLEHLNASVPFFERAEWSKSLAALAAVYRQDMDRVVPGPNRKVYELLHSAAAAERTEWYFNNLRARHAIATSRLSLLPVGTTLSLKLKILQLSKQMTHNAALYHETTRQMAEAEVLARTSSREMWSLGQWHAWCDELQDDAGIKKASLHFHPQRENERDTVRARVFKRPAANMADAPPTSGERRTLWTGRTAFVEQVSVAENRLRNCVAVFATLCKTSQRASQLGLFWETLPQVGRPIAVRGRTRGSRPTAAAVLGAACCCAVGPVPHVGQPEGVTLLDCIETCAAPLPGRMSFVQRLKWRKDIATRPLKSRDGRFTTSEEEVALWRSVMEFLHEMQEGEEEEEEEEDEEDLPPSMAPSMERLSLRGRLPPPRRTRPLPQPLATGLTAAGDGALAVVAVPADRRRALRAHGVAISSGERDLLTTKASRLAEEFGQVGGDWHPTRVVRRLRARFSVAALMEGDDGDAAEIEKEIQTIGELILAAAGRAPAPTRFGALMTFPRERPAHRRRRFPRRLFPPAAKAPQLGPAAAKSGAPTIRCVRGREALKEALSARGGQNSITSVKTDNVWPTLTDDNSDTMQGRGALSRRVRGRLRPRTRERLLALKVISDPEAVYLRIKNKHLMFGESREEREVRVDGEHQAFTKGKLTGHQFEPLFEASIADFEEVVLGKT
ncbi:unnamed protein product, partial [Symbiodinium sp. CCMP2456]